MAEPIGLAAGLLALATFAFECSISLHETVNSFRHHPKRVRDLLEELEALSAVLGPLGEFVKATSDIDFSALELPLLRCGGACNEFRQEILKCSSQPGSNRTNFREWARLKYMGDDIDGFRRLLAGYKATINIALTDANIRQTSANTEALEDYKHLIQDAKDDLEARLESIDDKLECIVNKSVAQSGPDAAELQSMKEERLSTEKCLQICAQLSDHIDQIQLTSDRSGAPHGSDSAHVSPERVTNDGLQECKNSLSLTAAKLEKHMQDVMNRILLETKTTITSEKDAQDLARLQDEWNTARQCLDICSKADDNLKENVSVIENYGTGDALQFMVSTNGKILHGKNRAYGWRTRQVGGYVSDASVQQLSRDIATINMNYLKKAEPSSTDGSIPDQRDAVESGMTAEYKQRYGRGFKLEPTSFPEASTSSTTSSSRWTGEMKK
ncbi:uncharacterized protein N7482_005358 [Penicillium canariense]|uniref:Azaphilone pigments biosynthesis cluster protein L N-terminal domain-containing protein n=1 Tax=Penicillium canariense TaxID=189055 RepID=A0A9W9I7U0_9EURO|nr:uncharacterized protein N7482_005358 [Penicillium canariense]KAJ5166577.1 hypothetical protein N7482_005358 [Penicillium canariense]